MKTIEFYYSSHSAFAYLGFKKLTEIAQAANRSITHRPMFLNKVVSEAHPDGFRKRSKAHYAYYFGREIDRWAQFRDVPLGAGIPANHSSDTTISNCVLIATQGAGLDIDRLANGFFAGHWVDHVDLADKDQLAVIMNDLGLDAEDLFAKAESEAVQKIYRNNTTHAIENTFFGSPTFVVDGDMFYGQDRLELVARALKQPFSRNWTS